ncbi:Transposase (plasmid) [Bacillus thuringiensis MC28]|nr:Transposase [Bacillus thuringiensis MC28]
MESTKSELNNVAIEVEALQEENERLRMEIDYLKKLMALVQKEKKLQNKTRRM